MKKYAKIMTLGTGAIVVAISIAAAVFLIFKREKFNNDDQVTKSATRSIKKISVAVSETVVSFDEKGSPRKRELPISIWGTVNGMQNVTKLCQIAPRLVNSAIKVIRSNKISYSDFQKKNFTSLNLQLLKAGKRATKIGTLSEVLILPQTGAAKDYFMKSRKHAQCQSAFKSD